MAVSIFCAKLSDVSAQHPECPQHQLIPCCCACSVSRWNCLTFETPTLTNQNEKISRTFDIRFFSRSGIDLTWIIFLRVQLMPGQDFFFLFLSFLLIFHWIRKNLIHTEIAWTLSRKGKLVFVAEQQYVAMKCTMKCNSCSTRSAVSVHRHQEYYHISVLQVDHAWSVRAVWCDIYKKNWSMRQGHFLSSGGMRG